MKKAPVFLLCAMFLLAFFLMGRGLISGPQNPDGERPEVLGERIYFSARTVTQEEESVPSARVSRVHRSEALRAEETAPVSPVCVCDQNGIPLTGRTWQKTVYLVCPPEGVPG